MYNLQRKHKAAAVAGVPVRGSAARVTQKLREQCASLVLAGRPQPVATTKTR